jgi:methyl-accepting chemotaxis protein
MGRTRAIAVAIVACAALAVSACGGDDGEVSASTQWAGDLCTAINTWRDSIAATASTLESDPSREGLEQAAADAEETTRTLIDTVKGLGAPDTANGDEARAAVESLATSLESDVDTIKEAVDGVSDVQGLLGAVSTVTATVANISTQLSSSLDDLSALRDADDELRQSFEDAESCDGVVPGS